MGWCPSERYDCRLGDLPMGSAEGSDSRPGDRGRMRCCREVEVVSWAGLAAPLLVAAATEAAALSWRCLCRFKIARSGVVTNKSMGV